MKQEEQCSEAEAQRALVKIAESVDEEKVNGIVDNLKRLLEALEKMPGRFGQSVRQARLFYEFLSDYRDGVYQDVPWLTIATLSAALIYVVSPIDLIPDFIPGIGWIDDVLVISLAVRAVRSDLRAYCAFKGYDPEIYFANEADAKD